VGGGHRSPKDGATTNAAQCDAKHFGSAEQGTQFRFAGGVGLSKNNGLLRLSAPKKAELRASLRTPKMLRIALRSVG
jgi:hypothetical protein